MTLTVGTVEHDLYGVKTNHEAKCLASGHFDRILLPGRTHTDPIEYSIWTAKGHCKGTSVILRIVQVDADLRSPR